MKTNTDINELIRQLRDSAQLALTAPDNNRCRNSDDRVRRIGMLRPLRDLCNADNILLILDALEAEQQYAKSRDEENQDLMLTVGRLRVEREQLEASQPVVPEWISVSDRLPENEDYVLAADSYDKYLNNPPRQQVACFGDWFGDGEPTWDDGDGNDLILNQVTHWMPLPAAPALQEE